MYGGLEHPAERNSKEHCKTYLFHGPLPSVFAIGYCSFLSTLYFSQSFISRLPIIKQDFNRVAHGKRIWQTQLQGSEAYDTLP